MKGDKKEIYERFFGEKKDKLTLIIGCGRLGANLANRLSEKGREVTIVDKNKDSFRKLSTSYGGFAISRDGTDYYVLEEARMKDADIVVAVTDNDNVNVMIAQIAREIYKVERVIARLYDPERECVYHEFGIDTICPAVLSAKEIDRVIFSSDEDEIRNNEAGEK